MRRVVITGAGLVSPLGRDPDRVFSALMAGQSALSSHHVGEDEPGFDIVAGLCGGFDGAEALGKPRARQMDRFSQLGAVAALDAWSSAGLAELPEDERGAISTHWGTGVGGTLTTELGYRDLLRRNRARISPLSVVLGMSNAAAAHIAQSLALGGPCLTYSVACASSAIAIGEALARVRSGATELALAGGSDAPLSLGTVAAWHSLQVLAPASPSAAGACRPFSANRSGLVLAEGAAALVLEEYEHAKRRGATILVEVCGYGGSCDHSHLTRPSGEGQVRALRAALSDAGVTADQIGYVNAHGTATPEGDPVEIAALRETFGNISERVALSSTKSMLGHTLGAAGAIEALIAAKTLQDGRTPPTLGLNEIDPACAGVRHITEIERKDPNLRIALSNSFAFGGSNAVLIFRRMD